MLSILKQKSNGQSQSAIDDELQPISTQNFMQFPINGITIISHRNDYILFCNRLLRRFSLSPMICSYVTMQTKLL